MGEVSKFLEGFYLIYLFFLRNCLPRNVAEAADGWNFDEPAISVCASKLNSSDNNNEMNKIPTKIY